MPSKPQEMISIASRYCNKIAVFHPDVTSSARCWLLPTLAGRPECECSSTSGATRWRHAHWNPVEVPTGFVYAGRKRKRASPCSGFSLCCIVHLLLLPDVFLLFGVIKLADPLFAAGLESGRVGLRDKGRRRAIKTCGRKHAGGRATRWHLHCYRQHLDWRLFRQSCRTWRCGEREKKQLCKLWLLDWSIHTCSKHTSKC